MGLVSAAACLAACSSAPAPAPKTAAAPLPAVTVGKAAAAPTVLTPVIAPSEPPDMGALARRLATMIDGARAQVTPFAIDVTSLPQVAMHKPLDPKAAAKLDRTKLKEEPNLTAKAASGYASQYMLSLTFKDPSKVTFGRVKLNGTYGANEGWFGEGFGAAMNVYQTCGRASDLVPLHWETLELDKDKLTYVVNDGVLDRMTCTVYRVTTSTATAKPLLPKGILFGFRACEGTCAEKEELTLLFPRSVASAAGALGGGADRATGSFSVVSFPLQRGGGGAFLARIMKRDVAVWQLRTGDVRGPKEGYDVSSDAARLGSMFLSSFELGVEVSQARDDEAPIAIAYMDIDPASLPPVPAPAAPAPSAPAASNAPVNVPRIGFNSLDPLSDRN